MLPSRLAQPFPVVAGDSPRIDAGMCDHQHRRPPVEGRLAKAVEMDDIGCNRLFQFYEEAPRTRQIVALRILPFEGETAFDDADARISEHRALFALRSRPHDH